MKIFTQRECTMVAPPAALKTVGRAGFTLIELSIVLIIVGLIIGGVLVGRDLIRAAQIRKQVSEWEKLNTSIVTFKGKYNCLPGDCLNASSFFSGTPNGNGDGIIFGDTDWYDASHYTFPERCYFFLHLGLAQLWPPLSGMDSICQSLNNIVPGVTMPALSVGNGSYFVSAQADSITGQTSQGQNHYICTASYSPTTPFIQQNSVEITTLDSSNLDTKIDDGLPLTGKVQAVTKNFGTGAVCSLSPTPSATGCVSTNAGNPYNLSNAATGCSLSVRLAF